LNVNPEWVDLNATGEFRRQSRAPPRIIVVQINVAIAKALSEFDPPNVIAQIVWANIPTMASQKLVGSA
jgi:hypothetical protein